jgi:hypothetical protein
MMDRDKLEQLYSFESVASAFSANGRLVADILWDRDCDIDHDLQSEDDEMRSMAERYFHSGLTAEYAKENIALIGKPLQIAATAAGLGKLKAVVHFGFGRIEWHVTKSPFTLGDAIRLLNESKVNLCDGGSEFYVQGHSYFQLGAIRYECPSGLSFAFKGWRLAEAIHTLASHESRVLTRAAVRPEPNRLYRTVHGAVVYILPHEQWSDGKPVGVPLGHESSPLTSGSRRASDRGTLTFTRDGSVDGLEEFGILPHHPDAVFALVAPIDAALPEPIPRPAPFGAATLDELCEE